ncbi:MAG: hypothetical protein KBT53_06940 [Porticoccus sp.]|nr:hypothetical protein [Porticoccus sp.]MBQ0806472.1 hypothetical protein [Porticoccus sp.]
MRFTLFVILYLAACHAIAQSDIAYERSGSVSTSVNATSQEGFDCATAAGKTYLLYELPVFFSTEFGKAGLLTKEYVGQYRLALIIDESSKITGYQVGPNIDKNSHLVQTILNLGTLPALSASNSCIAGKPFIFEFTLT